VINKKGRLLSFDEPFRVVLMKTIQGGEFDAREMESVLVEWWPGSGARSRRTIGTRGRPSCRSSPCCGSSCRCRASSLRGRRRWRGGLHAAGQLACWRTPIHVLMGRTTPLQCQQVSSKWPGEQEEAPTTDLIAS
jgi:hypothetical protein